ncbi:hypothetical protein Fcan01_26958 [Folsomia candida]|uniref:Uncharacterized protein n=1 Tax=Folsomia candida TaxID=158441 RepID=A0A226CZN2_FOLCA|nr:hypothetical protein Fcan01_26958 [Folsomia candida]
MFGTSTPSRSTSNLRSKTFTCYRFNLGKRISSCETTSSNKKQIVVVDGYPPESVYLAENEFSCETYHPHQDRWNISILGLPGTFAKKMGSKHPELLSGSSSILAVEAMSYHDARNSDHFMFQNGVRDTFSAMKNKPQAILNLATTYINSLEVFKYHVISTETTSSHGSCNWTFTLEMKEMCP